MKAIASLIGSLMASEAFVVPSALNRAFFSTAGASPPCRQVLSCSASPASPGPAQSRVAFVKNAGLAVGAIAASMAAPVAALALATDDAGEEEDALKVGDERTTDSGLMFLVTAVGKGAKPTPGSTIKAHYTGWLNAFGGEEGVKFDSSRDRGRPFSFKVGTGMVIKAWDEALLDMKIGERRQITVPPQLGYGSRGAGGLIPPNATLYFDVELLSVQL